MKSHNILLRSTLLIAMLLIPYTVKASTNIGSVEDTNVINGDFHVPAGETVARTVLVTNGTAFIEGTLKGSCIADDADIIVTGHVTGEVGSIGRNKSVTISGLVDQGVTSYSGQASISGKAGYLNAYDSIVKVSSGSVKYIRTFNSKVDAAPGTIIETLTISQFAKCMPDYYIYHRDPVYFKVVQFSGLAAGVGITLLLSVFFLLRRTESMVMTLETDFWKSFGLGLAAVLGDLALIYLCLQHRPIIFLSIPFIVSGLSAAIIGTGAFCRMTGNKFAALNGKDRPQPLTAAAAGYLALLIICLPLILCDFLPKPLVIASLFVGITSILLWASIGVGALLLCAHNPFRRE